MSSAQPAPAKQPTTSAISDVDAPSIRAVLAEHTSLSLSDDGRRIRCSLTGHEVPSSNAAALVAYVNGERYRKARKWYSRPLESFLSPELLALANAWLSPNRASDKRLYCRLTRRNVNRIPREIIKHLLSAKFERALEKRGTRADREGRTSGDEDDEDVEEEEEDGDAVDEGDADDLDDAEVMVAPAARQRVRQRDQSADVGAGAGTGAVVGAAVRGVPGAFGRSNVGELKKPGTFASTADSSAVAIRRGNQRVAFSEEAADAPAATGGKRAREGHVKTKAEKRRARIVSAEGSTG